MKAKSCRTPGWLRRDFYSRLGIAVSTAALLQACASPERLEQPPVARVTSAIALNTPNARFYVKDGIAAIAEESLRSVKREMRALGVSSPSELPPANFLAISGGADDGAFGAGLLKGWTESGTRPQFKVVTGVSTGALTAPFAFLGPRYDSMLEEVYTKINAANVFEQRGLIAALFDDALADTTPLFRTISRYVDEKLLAEIATEYEKGRLLVVGTTNLDAQLGVIWNIGAIAASGQPGAVDLVRKILLASAAVPGAFPPVMVDVELDGKRYQEMHVDGGAIAQLFLYPPDLGAEVRAIKRTKRAFIVRNATIGGPGEQVERRFVNVAGRAISTMISVSGMNDLFRVYFTTQRDGVDYNLAIIGSDFTAPPGAGEFDPIYMKALFDYGYAKGRSGYSWLKAPPRLESQR